MSIPQKSKAAVLVEYKKPLEIQEIPVPEVEPGAMLARVDAVTICGTDLHIWQGKLKAFSTVPSILGHEIVGRIVAIGKGGQKDVLNQPLKEGDRVIWAYAHCNHCYWCTIARQPSLCPNIIMYGWAGCSNPPYLMGGFSEYVYILPQCKVNKVPDEVPSSLAASASCALRTVVHGFERLRGFSTQETVLVQGAGPVGLYATALARVSGAGQIIVFGAPASRLELAREWGAHHVVNIQEMDIEQRKKWVLEWTEGRGPDVVIEAVGATAAVKEGLDLIRRGGRYLIIGGSDTVPLTIPSTIFVFKQIEIIGVLSAHAPHYYRALQFLKNYKDFFSFQKLITNTYPLERINEALMQTMGLQEIKPAIVPT
jgi:threonine dehydrogenase-like Zn-dependent dehydrogenase